MNAIKKAIIPCGGLGTRFLPVTKAIPKEILPVIDTPVLAYIVDELTASGVDQIMIILGKGKEAIRDYFTVCPRFEKALENKPEFLETLRRIGKNAEIRFGMQEDPRGSGDAVMRAREFTADEDAALVLGVQKVERSETDKYGIINPTSIDGRVVRCDNIIEKPKSDPPSLYAALGRYVLTPEIYEYIEKSPEKNGEISLTDAICAVMRDGRGYAYEFEGRRYDMGDKFGALTATVDFALKRPEFKDKFKKYLRSVLRDED